MNNGVKGWDILLKMWRENAKTGDGGIIDSGEEYLTIKGNNNYWIKQSEEFLLFRPLPPPALRQEVAHIAPESPDNSILRSAFQQCTEVNLP